MLKYKRTNAKNRPTNSKLKPKGKTTKKLYSGFSNLLYKKKIKLFSENLLNKRAAQGPAIVLGTHDLKPLRIEPFLIQTMSKKHIHWISSLAIRPFGKRIVISKTPVLNKLTKGLENIEIDRRNLTVAETRRMVSEGINILKEGKVLGAFPTAYTESTAGFGHSGALYIANKAQQELGIKIPIILVSIKKVKNKYHVIQQEVSLPDKVDRNTRQRLTNEYISKLQRLYACLPNN
ncbi:MAG TPA: hypothetical protein P5530_00930 [Candidatus Diapherotrites archaeon]|nr:hypothetical protein [Candidatus Diapherotrites archaeon]